MCGIAGILHSDRCRPVDPNLLRTMGAAIAHRGPDAEGYWEEVGIGLVHRRLSIIDLAAGNQPIGNEDGSVQIVFNGEIYNYLELRADLASRGHRFTTQSDTEVLVHLYEEEGEALVERLRGMFAFALWDRSRHRLILARDRLGIKPLYLYRDEEKLVFGSELKAVLVHPDIDRRVDAASLDDYFAYGMVPGTRSIFAGIEKLAPAHVLVVEPECLDRNSKRYWQLRFDPNYQRGPDEWSEMIRAKLHEAVQSHLVSDVPVGAFLSGGLDSSVVVALGAAGSPTPLHTFSIGFREEGYSELPYARQVAEQFGTRHSEQIVTADAVELLDELAFYFDEPFADSSAVPTFLLSRLASRSVKVVLSGDGGDEAFGGYARYVHDLREATVRRWLPGWFRRAALGPLAQAWPKTDWLPRPLRIKTFLSNLSLDPDRAYANTLTSCRLPLRHRLMGSDFVKSLNGHDSAHAILGPYAAAPSREPLAGMISADVATFLPDDYLVKVDRASMAHGLEVRPPLLDHEVLELAAQIPSKWKVRQGEGKWIFKRAYEDRLPAGLVRRRKQGFEIPLNEWLRGPLRDVFESSVLNPSARVGDLIDQPMARKLYRDHLSGMGRYGNVLWTILILARWADLHLTGLQPRCRSHSESR